MVAAHSTYMIFVVQFYSPLLVYIYHAACLALHITPDNRIFKYPGPLSRLTSEELDLEKTWKRRWRSLCGGKIFAREEDIP